jgi:hypothetical protein
VRWHGRRDCLPDAARVVLGNPGGEIDHICGERKGPSSRTSVRGLIEVEVRGSRLEVGVKPAGGGWGGVSIVVCPHGV